MPSWLPSTSASTPKPAASVEPAHHPQSLRVQRLDRPLLFFLLALAPRLALVILLRLPIGLDDMFQYDMLARSIVAGHGYRWYAEDDLKLIQRYIGIERPPDYDPRGVLTSFRAPGYPVFLTLVYAICGTGPQRFFAARLAQAVLGATLAPLTWVLALRAGFGGRAAKGAALVIAFFPLLIVYTLALASENLFTPLVALALLLVLGAGERGRARDWALAGLVLGLAALTRSIISAFVPLVALWAWRTGPSQAAGARLRTWVGRAAALVLAFIAVTTPWMVRNSLLHHRLTWIETSLGYNLYIGYHPQANGTFDVKVSLDLLPILDDAERDARGRTAAWQFIQAAPNRLPYLMVRKAGYLWELDLRALLYFYSNGLLGHWPGWLLGLIMGLDCLPWMGVASAAAVGLMGGPFDRRRLLPMLFVAYYMGVHMLTMSEPRFHLPLLPLLAAPAACALGDRVWRQCRPLQRWLALSAVALLLANWGLQLSQGWETLRALFGPSGATLHLPY
jgi:4-amino-4-deoxy-L-arabinose transferase-like glycosyltransferase